MNSNASKGGSSAALVAVASLATFLSNMSAGIVNVPIAEITRALGGGDYALVAIMFISTQIREHQGLAFGFWRAALLSGTVAGPVIGGYLAVALGWRSLFWLAAPLAGALWLWALFLLEELPRRKERFDWVGSLIFLVGFSAFVVALAVSGMDTMQAGLTTAIGKTMGAMALMLYGVFVVAMILLWINQKTEKKPLFDVSLYRIRPFVLGNLGTWLVCVGMFSAMMFVPLELQYVRGYSELQATNSLLPLTVTAIVVGVWGGQITDRLGATLPWAAGFLVMTAGFVALAALGPQTPPALLFAIMTATGFGMALPLAPTAVTALTTVPEEAAGEAGGLFNFAHNMGRAMGLGILGALLVLDAAGSYSLIFWVTAGLMAVAAALTLGLPARKAAPSEVAR